MANEPSRRSGCLVRLIKLVVVGTGMVALAALVDGAFTARALKGSWRYSHAEWSEATVGLLLSHGVDDGDGGNVPDPATTHAVARVGNALVSALTSNVTLELTDGGYRLEGRTWGSRLATDLVRKLGAGPDRLGGCTSGSFSAAFPLVHAVCGDGSGRTLWLLMTGWPGEELELLLLPVGNARLRDKVEQLTSGAPTGDRAQAAREILTLRFTRNEP